VEIIRENGNIKVDLREIDCDCVNGTEGTRYGPNVCDGQWRDSVWPKCVWWPVKPWHSQTNFSNSWVLNTQEGLFIRLMCTWALGTRHDYMFLLSFIYKCH